MATTSRKFWIAIACAGLAACGTTGERSATRTGDLEVTRFHLGGAVAPGEVVIQPRFTGGLRPVSEFGSDSAVVARELARLGFTPGSRPASEYLADIDVAAGSLLELQARAPGLAEAPATPGAAPRLATQAQLAVELKRRSDGSIVWRGRARMPHPSGQPVTPAQVGRLAAALFRDFPGQSGETIRVR